MNARTPSFNKSNIASRFDYRMRIFKARVAIMRLRIGRWSQRRRARVDSLSEGRSTVWFLAGSFAAIAVFSGLFGYWLGHRELSSNAVTSGISIQNTAGVQSAKTSTPRSTSQAVDTGALLERVMSLQARSETLDNENAAMRNQIIAMQLENQRIRSKAEARDREARTQGSSASVVAESSDTSVRDSTTESQRARSEVVYNITNVTDGSLLTARQKTREQMDANQDGVRKEVMIYLDGGSAAASVEEVTTESMESQQTPIDQ